MSSGLVHLFSLFREVILDIGFKYQCNFHIPLSQLNPDKLSKDEAHLLNTLLVEI